jgi:hypothetical protein
MTGNSSFSHKIAADSAVQLDGGSANPPDNWDSNRFERMLKLIFQSLTQLELACNLSRNKEKTRFALEGAISGWRGDFSAAVRPNIRSARRG